MASALTRTQQVEWVRELVKAAKALPTSCLAVTAEEAHAAHMAVTATRKIKRAEQRPPAYFAASVPKKALKKVAGKKKASKAPVKKRAKKARAKKA